MELGAERTPLLLGMVCLLYTSTMFGDGIKMAFLQVPFILDEDKKLCGEFFAEQEGFSLIARCV